MNLNQKLGIAPRATTDNEFYNAFGDGLKDWAKNHPAIFGLVNPIGGAVAANQNKPQTTGSGGGLFGGGNAPAPQEPPVIGASNKPSEDAGLSTPAIVGISLAGALLLGGIIWGISKIIK